MRKKIQLMPSLTHLTMEESTVVGSNFEANVTRFLLAVNEGKRQCYAEAFELLYRAFGRGKSYSTLQEFFVQALGWKTEQLANLLQQVPPEFIGRASGSSGEDCQENSRSDTWSRHPSIQSSSVFSETSSPLGRNVLGGLDSPLEIPKLSPFLENQHIVQSTKDGLQESQSLTRETGDTKGIFATSDGVTLEHVAQPPKKDSETEVITMSVTTAETQVKDPNPNRHRGSKQLSKSSSQSVKITSQKNPLSRLRPPRKVSQSLKETDQRLNARLPRSRKVSPVMKESSQKPQDKSNPPRICSQSLRESNKKPQGILATPRKTSLTMKEPSRIPQLRSDQVKSVCHPARRNSQKYQVTPGPKKVSGSTEKIRQDSLSRTTCQGIKSSKATTYPARTGQGTRVAVKKISSDALLPKPETCHVTNHAEGSSHVSLVAQSLKETIQEAADKSRQELSKKASEQCMETNQRSPQETNQKSVGKNNQKSVKDTGQKPQSRIRTTENNLLSSKGTSQICYQKSSLVQTPSDSARKDKWMCHIKPDPKVAGRYLEKNNKKILTRAKSSGGTAPSVTKSLARSKSSGVMASHGARSLARTKSSGIITSGVTVRSPGSVTGLRAEVIKSSGDQHVLSTKKNSKITPTQQGARRASVPKQESNSVSVLQKNSSHDALITEETNHITVSERESNQTAPFRDETDWAIADRQVSSTSSTDQDSVFVSCTEQEVIQGLPTRETGTDISSIIDKANQTLEQHSHQTRVSVLSSEPDASQLPQTVLVLLLTDAFQQLPSKAKMLIKQLQQFSSIVCYQDMEFTNDQLSLRLRDLSRLIAELISVVVDYCKGVAEKHIKEISEELRTSKKKLRSAQKDYDDQLSWVIQTQHELEVAERNLQEKKQKNSEILKVYSRSHSQESKASSDSTIPKVQSSESQHPYPLSVNSPYCCDSKDDLLDSKEQSLETSCHDGDDETSNTGSLLSSVMKEVAVIEKKHSSASEHDKKLRTVLRNTQESMIEYKKEMRNRLDSNVSAEEDAISKQDILSEKQAATRKLSKTLKNLQSDCKALKATKNAIIQVITENIEAVRTMEVDKEALSLGQLSMHMIREEESGRLLLESRQEAMAFASQVKIADLGEWLMMKHDVTKQIQQVYSSLRVNNSKNIVSILDIVGAGDEDPSIVVLCGPAGSGKSCMCLYLLHQWKSNRYVVNSKLYQFDLVLYCTMANIMLAGSWSQYLKEHIFCTTLNDFPSIDIHEALASMSVLFLIDVGSLTPPSSKVLKEVFMHVGKNRVVVTARPGSEMDIMDLASNSELCSISAKLCPMTPEAIRDYCTQLISYFKQQDSSVNDKVSHFTKLLHSMNAGESLLYPLPLTYLMYLWRVDPGHAVRAKSLSRLFTEVVVVCEHTLSEVIRVKSRGDRGEARVNAEEYTNQLYEAAWKLVTHQDWPHHNHAFLSPQHSMLQDQTIYCNFAPLLVVREGVDGKHQGDLPHLLLAEVLCGFYLSRRRLSPLRGSPLFRRREKLEKYCVPDIKRFRYVVPHTAGALVYNKHTVEDAREVASLFMKSLTEKQDMVSWLLFLRECDFLSTMCTAVSEVLAQYSCWTASHHTQQNNCAVADMLKRGAYQPQKIVISQTSQDGIICIIRALATCSSTLVHLRQDAQFYNWGQAETCDSLVVPLQPPGTLHECWGHLGVEGAMALRHSHHLEELNVRISSPEALSALVHSMGHIRRSLRYLYLRLDLQPSTPLSGLQPLNFKGKQLWLRLRGITDASLGWLKNVLKILNTWYTEVVLEESSLSPAELQTLKESMPQTRVHISG